MSRCRGEYERMVQGWSRGDGDGDGDEKERIKKPSCHATSMEWKWNVEALAEPNHNAHRV